VVICLAGENTQTHSHSRCGYRMIRSLLLAALSLLAIVPVRAVDYWEITSGPTASTRCMATNSKGHVFAGTENSAVYRTTNLGADWVRLDNNIDDGGPNFVTVNSIICGANDELIIAVNGLGIFRSRDNGDTWQKLNLGVTIPSNARLTVSSKLTADKSKTMLFVGLDAGASNLAMFLSENSGDSFVSILKSNLPGAVSSLFETFLSPNSDKLFVLVSYNKGLYRSVNRGTSWTRIDSDPQSGESDDNFKTMTYDKLGHLYVGRNALASSTRSKNAIVMKSTNDGESWFYLDKGWNNNDITNNKISGIAIAENGELYATTEKSGTFYSSDFGANWIPRNEGMSGDGSANAVTITNRRHAFIAPIGPFIFRHLDPSTSVLEERSPMFSIGVPTPNPVSDVVRVSVTAQTAAALTAQIVDAAGQVVVPTQTIAVDRGLHTLQFRTEALAPGVYHARIFMQGGVSTTAFVVAR